MATSGARMDERGSKLTLDIRTKSVEQTLVPLVTQITTLVNAKEKPIRSERALSAMVRVGHAVNMAVERFVKVGEAIARENPDIQHDMCNACQEAKAAGSRIQKLTNVKMDEPGTVRTMAEKTAMVRAARQLLSAITKVLILADRVVIKQLIIAKDKVSSSLSRIESCTSFADFVKAFSQFGNEMVELAHLSGDRQNDLKSEKSRTQMGAARSILEKSTMMLLTTAKTYLRHSDCISAKQNRDCVFQQMRKALDVIHHVATDGGHVSGDVSPSTTVNGDSGISLSQHQPTAFKALKEFEDQVEMTRVTLVGPNIEGRLLGSLETVIETTQDFTDSAYTSHENRERILMLCEKLRHELAVLLRAGINLDQKVSSAMSQELETAILKTKEASRSLKKQLIDTSMDQASDVFKLNEDHELLAALKMAGLDGQKEKVDELSVKFEEHSEQLQEVCKLLKHISGTESLIIWSEHMESIIKAQTPEMIQSTKTLASFSNSKIAMENMEVFANAWVTQINDLSVLVKDVNDVCQGRSDRQVYLSLPRPGRHGANTRGLKPVHLSSEEQAKIAKVGLEMKLITSEMDAEAEKWVEPDNEIVCRAKNMSSMAFSIYLFTRGEGPLKTTQDLFTQAEYFAEEGAKLFKTVKEFSQQVPPGSHKADLVILLDKLPIYCQQLNFTIKSQTIGKAATFNKVDQVIQETKNLMNAVAKVVTSCFVCATKFSIAYRGQMVTKWSPVAGTSSLSNTGTGGNEGSDRDSVRSAGGRSEPFRRSLSLTSKPPSNMSSLDRL